MLDFVLYLLGFICFVAGVAFRLTGEPGPRRIDLIALGLAFWIFVPLHHAAGGL